MHLTIITGSPGVGKSTFGRELAAESGACLLDIDTCSELLVRAGLRLADQDPEDRDSSLFKETFREPIYESLFRVAAENLPHVPVVIVGPFTREIRDTEWLSKLKDRFQCPVEIYYLYCDPQERYQRLVDRANPRDRLKFKDYNTFNQYYGEEAPPAFEHIYVDTSK